MAGPQATSSTVSSGPASLNSMTSRSACSALTPGAVENGTAWRVNWSRIWSRWLSVVMKSAPPGAPGAVTGQVVAHAFDAAGQAIHDLIDLVSSDAEWRRERDDVAARQRAHDQPVLHAALSHAGSHLEVRRKQLARGPIRHQLDAGDEPHPAHVAHEGQLAERRAQRFLEVWPHARGVSHEILAQDDVEIGHGGGRAHRMAAVGEAVREGADVRRAVAQHAPDLLGDEAGREREVAAGELL